MPARSVLFFLFAVLMLLLEPVESAAESAIDFSRDIKPILSDKCYACHGPDANQREGGGENGLRFDIEEGAFVDLGGYQAIVPGDPMASELILRITSEDADIVMPPSDHPKSLTTDEIAKLTAWVKEGAKWSQHWAYRPLERQTNRSGDWIDQLIRQSLKEHDSNLSPLAEDGILLRRVHFDLLGLPPTASDLKAFSESTDTDRWEKLVDDLLDSPHFGERMAIYWLDLVRYADTVGYHGDQDMSVSPYRDYVINAFNSNKPFDQFTLEQLAGDLLDDATDEQKIASGYNKLGMMSAEGGAQPKEYLAKYASDRVRTASTVWLGSTLGCAECHDHKFDPFTQKDFYQFASYFADIKERGLYSGANRDGKWGPSLDVPDDNLAELLAPHLNRKEELERQYNETAIDGALASWSESLSKPGKNWLPLQAVEMQALNGTKLEKLEGKSILASGPGAEANTYSLVFEPELSKIAGVRIEALPHDSLPAQGPGRAGNGNFVLTELKIDMIDGDSDARPIKLKNALASFEQTDGGGNPYKGWKAIAAIDADEKGAKWGWAVMPKFGVSHAWIAEFEVPIELTEGQQIRVAIEQNHDNPGHTLGHFRFSVTDGAVKFDPRRAVPAEILAVIDRTVDQRSDQDLEVLSQHYRSISPELAEVRKQLDQVNQQIADLKAQHTRTTLVTLAVEPREMRVLARGNWMDDSGEVVTPGPPHFLPQPNVDAPRQNRRDLAQWLVSSDNPLTARVFVNRIWKLFFGTGLSKVLDDIGSQGEFPTHPELLDALAVEFIESGWDVKHLVRLILNTDVYRQSSLPRLELRELDPYNRLLARQSRFRLDAEMVRDNALSVSGLLVSTVGGRSVKPYQPSGLLRHLNFPTRKYQADKGVNQYRRGLYTHWQRQFLHPAMKLFDAPAREECSAERPRSNTPLAALVLLNDPSYVEAARVFAEKALRQNDLSEQQRLEWILSWALTREPYSGEVEILAKLLDSHRIHYQQAKSEATELLKIGDQPVDDSLDPLELASYVAVTRAIFNMHEFITRN